MGKALAITRTDHTASELRTRAAKCDEAGQARRMLAIALILDGASRQDAARLTGMDRQTLRDWVPRYNADGIDGLLSRKPPGAAAKLTEVQWAAFRQQVIDGPTLKEHKVIRWRCVDLCSAVERRFAVTVCERTMGKWLRKMGLTRLQPRPYHLKKDAAAQEALKKLSFPPEGSPCRLHRRHIG
jgi:transposase